MPRNPSKEELALWQAIIQDIKPIERKNSVEPQPPIRKRIQVQPQRYTPSLPEGIFNPVGIALLNRQQYRYFSVQARLDLHGYTQAEAYKALVNFITVHYEQHQRNLLIITGKGSEGQGILKQQLPRWLETAAIYPKILAIAPARPEDGGQGAFYILLRRSR